METTLAAIPSASEQERVAVILCADEINGSRIELRQQTWGEGVGWFTQSSIELEPHQVAGLRNALGITGHSRLQNAAKLSRKHPRMTKAGFSPRVVRAEPA